MVYYLEEKLELSFKGEGKSGTSNSASLNLSFGFSPVIELLPKEGVPIDCVSLLIFFLLYLYSCCAFFIDVSNL